MFVLSNLRTDPVTEVKVKMPMSRIPLASLCLSYPHNSLSTAVAAVAGRYPMLALCLPSTGRPCWRPRLLRLHQLAVAG